MASKQKDVQAPQTLLQEIAEEFRHTIFYQHNLIELVKDHAANSGMDTVEALALSIHRFNEDLYSYSFAWKTLRT